MIKKHKEVFERMYQKYQSISERKGEETNLLDIARDFVPLFEKDGIGALGIAHHLAEYIKKREKELNHNYCISSHKNF